MTEGERAQVRHQPIPRDQKRRTEGAICPPECVLAQKETGSVEDTAVLARAASRRGPGAVLIGMFRMDYRLS